MNVPELLTSIETADVGKYVLDSRFAMQPKRDGKRLLINVCNTKLIWAAIFNKRGELCNAPGWLLKSLPEHVTIDGELEKGRFVIYDLLDCLGHDLRSLPYSQRLAALVQAVKSNAITLPDCCQLIDTWFTPEDKERQLIAGFTARWEGVVFKKLDAPYSPGRAGQHLKLKFFKSCTVRIRTVEPTSARVEMLDKGWVEVSGVSLIGRPRVKVGDFLEVKYLYATTERNGDPRLVQPVMLNLRDDVGDADCTINQLVFKNTEAA